MENNKRIFFVQKIGENEYETESIWCQQQGNDFVIDNIPFIAKNVSLGDTIKAELDEEDGQYYFDDFKKSSGNTTIRIYFFNSNDIPNVREWLKKNECESEVLQARNIVALNIPKKINYTFIRDYLEKGEQDEKWTYEESCLEHKY